MPVFYKYVVSIVWITRDWRGEIEKIGNTLDTMIAESDVDAVNKVARQSSHYGKMEVFNTLVERIND